MNGRILKAVVSLHRLTPAEAEVRVQAERLDGQVGGEIKGRLMGPRCPGVTTVEVAYPFRLLPSPSSDTWLLRAIIPEPSLWTETTPFVYEGPLELWQDGQRLDHVSVSVGLKFGGSTLARPVTN